MCLFRSFSPLCCLVALALYLIRISTFTIRDLQWVLEAVVRMLFGMSASQVRAADFPLCSAFQLSVHAHLGGSRSAARVLGWLSTPKYGNSGSWLCSGLGLAAVDIGGVNQRMEDLCVCLFICVSSGCFLLVCFKNKVRDPSIYINFSL